MKICVYSKDRNLFNFITPLSSIGCSISEYNETNCKEADLLIFDSEFGDNVYYDNCIKIENATGPKKTNHFSLSLMPGTPGVDHLVPALCTLMPPGVVRDDFVCDISSNNQPASSIPLLYGFLSLENKIRVFSSVPLNIFCYCGVIPPMDTNDLYVSSKVNLCTTEYSLINVIQAGGVPFSNVGSLDIPEELKFTEGNCEEKLRHVLPRSSEFMETLSGLREEIIKERNIYNQWSNILNKIGLKKLSERCSSHGRQRTKDLLSQ